MKKRIYEFPMLALTLALAVGCGAAGGGRDTAGTETTEAVTSAYTTEYAKPAESEMPETPEPESEAPGQTATPGETPDPGEAKPPETNEDAENDKILVLYVPDDPEPGISTMPLEITLSVTDYKDGILTAVFFNQSGYTMTIGEDWYLEKLEDGEWVAMEPAEPYSWPDIAWVIEDLSEKEMQYDTTVFGSLDEGKYRLIASELTAGFELLWSRPVSDL